MPTPLLDLRSNTQINADQPGLGLFLDGANIILGPWVQVGEAREGRLPDSIFWDAPPVVNIDYDVLTSNPDARMNSVVRDNLESRLGYPLGSLPNSTFADILAHFILGSLADPTGVNRVKPLRGGRDLFKLAMSNFGELVRERFNTAHPNFQPTIDVRWADYRRHITAGTNLDTLRRWTDYDCHKLFRRSPTSADLDLLLPTERRGDGSLPHRTTITDSFPGADQDVLAGDLTWTEVIADWDRISNQAKLMDTTENAHARADSDLSSDDHYAQADDTGTGGQSTISRMVTGRVNSSNSERYAFKVQDTSGNSTRLLRYNSSNSATGLALITDDATNADVVLKIEVNGSSLEGFVDAVSRITFSPDTVITGNLRGGIGGQIDNAAHDMVMDLFEAADLAAAANPKGPLGHPLRGPFAGPVGDD